MLMGTMVASGATPEMNLLLFLMAAKTPATHVPCLREAGVAEPDGGNEVS